MKSIAWCFGCGFGLAVFFALVLRGSAPGASASENAKISNNAGFDQATQVSQLREQVKKLEGLVPDQAAVMMKVGYHFTSLWFAANHDNWPLAEFYLGEARNNLKWAVRTKPIRKGPTGDIDLGGIAQAVDNTQFAALKKAIDARQRDQFEKAYEETLTACYACHKASGKPYLRPEMPSSPEVQIINLDPNAKWPD